MIHPRRRLRLVHSVGGVLLIVLGCVLLSHTTATIGLIIALLCAGLVVAGVLRFMDALQATRWRAVHLIAALLLVASGLLLALWRTASLPVLALTVSLVLLVAGVLRLTSVFSKATDARWRGVLSAATGLFASVLVIFWPRLSLWVLAITFGGWLVILGIHILYQIWADKIPTAPRWVSPLARFGTGLLTALGLLVVLALGAVTALLYDTGSRAVPDEFYLSPASVPDRPGQLLRSEPLDRMVPAGAQAWRILYTTTDHLGAATLSSAVVTVPETATAALPVISWANGTKGVQPSCALSLADDPYEDGPHPARAQMLNDGWAVVATDYPGLGTIGPHPYLVPQAEAAAMLDATRAAAQLPGIQLGKKTVLWGHSQGGHTALSAAALAPEYAPEFTVLGVAAMAPASDLSVLASSVANSAAGKVVSSYIAASWDRLYPDLGIGERLGSGASRTVERIASNCFTGGDVLTAMAEASQLFEPIFPPNALHGEIGERLEANSAPIGLPAPVFLAQGGADSLVSPAMQQQWSARACAAGTAIYYRQYPGLEHMGLVADDSPLNADLVHWSQQLLNGQLDGDYCAN